MLRSPEEYNVLVIEVMCLTMEIVYKRVMDIDNSILDDHITKEEYKDNLEDLFTSL